jgi:hypothetical protein
MILLAAVAVVVFLFGGYCGYRFARMNPTLPKV